MKLNEFDLLSERKRKKRRSKSAYSGGIPYYGYYYGSDTNSGDSGGVEESRGDAIEDFKPEDTALDDLKSRFLPDWEMLNHRTLQAKYVAPDHRYALKFVAYVNSLSEKMDHFAEVTVKTSTFDVKGLTILDFQLAMYVDNYAKKHNIEQVRMQGNFGMHP